MRRSLVCLLSAAALTAASFAALTAASFAALPAAQATRATERPATAPAAHIHGIVPALHSASSLRSGGNLSYHRGPVMRTNKVYAIFVQPSGYTMSAGYQPLINRFFTDVAADSGKSSNVYWSDTQYSDSTGKIAYTSAFGGSWTDSSALPASGCTDAYTSVCLSDGQIQAEVTKAISANGWVANGTTEFFVFTAKGIGSCAGTSCAFSQYCAYHSWIGSGSTAVLYANMPYADTVPAACDAGQKPNGDDADATLNVTSHEHNETITDHDGNAWYDLRGYENGDKCAWKFGTATGSTSFGSYNQTINGNHYYLQQEWSNATSRCVLTGL